MPGSIPFYTQEHIEKLVGRRNMHHGRDYLRSGVLVDARRRGSSLSASCIGSSRTPYQVEVAFGEQGVRESRCSCPVGKDGSCRHVATLLLAWLEQPQLFTNTESGREAVGRCSRNALIDVVRRLIDQHPEVERMIEPLLPIERQTGAPLPGADVRREVALQIDRAESGETLADALGSIKAAGDKLLRQRDFAAAADVYRAVVRELVQRPDLLEPRNPKLLRRLAECVDDLNGCIAFLSESSDERRAALRALVDVYRLDVRLGGLPPDMNLRGAILSHLSTRDESVVADWLRAMLDQTPVDDADSQETRRAVAGLLLDVLGSQIDDSERLDLCRRTGRTFDLVRRLLQHDRPAEAVAEAGRATDDDLIAIADLLVRYRQAHAAVGLVSRRAEETKNAKLGQWLIEFERRRADLATLLDLSQQQFEIRPAFESYRQIRELARQLGHWEAVRRSLIDAAERIGDQALLLRIFLDESDLDRALALVDDERADAALVARVATAVERARPLEAQSLYRRVIDSLIAGRDCDHYAEAARYARKIREIMKRTDALRQWRPYREELSERCRPLGVLLHEADRKRTESAGQGKRVSEDDEHKEE